MMKQKTTSLGKERARQSLTNLASILHNGVGMARFSQVADDLGIQVVQDAERIHAIYGELRSLREAYNRFRDLSEELRNREARLKNALALLGRERMTKLGGGIKLFKDDVFSLDAHRQKLPLWEAVVEILRQLPEAQVAEICHLLQEFGIKQTRQAVESAIETHKDRFRIKKRGREKFISLKE